MDIVNLMLPVCSTRTSFHGAERTNLHTVPPSHPPPLLATLALLVTTVAIESPPLI